MTISRAERNKFLLLSDLVSETMVWQPAMVGMWFKVSPEVSCARNFVLDDSVESGGTLKR
jgi:hypothetical protein